MRGFAVFLALLAAAWVAEAVVVWVAIAWWAALLPMAAAGACWMIARDMWTTP